ncbi:hypothetical protein ACQ143_13265 [Microbacterium sp. MC2]
MNNPTTGIAPTALELLQTDALQQRSLSLPLSRIVINPQDFMSDASEVAQNCGPTFPLGLGYYAFDEATILPQFLTLWAVAPGATSPAVSLGEAVAVAATGWSGGDDVHLETRTDCVTVFRTSADGGHLSTARTRVSIGDQTPVLRVSVGAVRGQWTLHVGRVGTEPVMVLPGAATLGQHYLDLRAYFPDGLSGEVELAIGVIGEGAFVSIDEMRFVPAADRHSIGASSYDTDWSPGGLGLEGHYSGLDVQGVDAFVDRDSVVRELNFSFPLSPTTPMTLVGRHIAPPSQDASGTVTVSASGICVAVAVSAGGPIRYYHDESELAAGGAGSPVPVSPVGVWAIPLLPGQARYTIGVAVTPDDPGRSRQLAVDATRASATERRQHWHEYWDDQLGRLPRPARFELRGVDAIDVGPEAVRAEYYRAFIGLLSNVLPQQPETGFRYPTVATGKASMWNYGAPGARSAAAWETFLAIQFLGYVDGSLAWSCFNGLMSLVDAEGSLAGESLPSRKAQTAWVLYCLTKDRDALAAGYPGLRRLLEWQAERPRWVYGTYDNPGELDAEFLSSLIVDLDFGVQIAMELAAHDDVTRFGQLRDQLNGEYRAKCFAGPQQRAIQHWFPDSDASLRGGPDGFGLQVSMGLAVPGLADWQVGSLLARFDSHFDPTDQLAGFDFVKHPNVSYTVRGLLERGREADALALSNAQLRDVIRSGSFAEVYDRGLQRPRPWGVRPSIFGMTQVLDAVWLNNGLRMDLGVPHAVALPGTDGGVSGIPLAGRRISLTVHDYSATIFDEATAAPAARTLFAAHRAGTAFPEHTY